MRTEQLASSELYPGKKGMSGVELYNEGGVQQKTAWLFRLKIKNATLKTDEFKSYVQMKHAGKNIETCKSDNGNF